MSAIPKLYDPEPIRQAFKVLGSIIRKFLRGDVRGKLITSWERRNPKKTKLVTVEPPTQMCRKARRKFYVEVRRQSRAHKKLLDREARRINTGLYRA